MHVTQTFIPDAEWLFAFARRLGIKLNSHETSRGYNDPDQFNLKKYEKNSMVNGFCK